jgi:uncharacterized membrane protein
MGNATARRLPVLLRVIRARPRLFLSGLIGLIVIVALPAAWRPSTRLLVGWDVGLILYLILAYMMIARSDVARIRRRAAVQDEGQTVLLILTVAAALASLVAIVAELGMTAGTPRQSGPLILATLTIVLSWGFIHSMFALHYAHEYYAQNAGHGGGLMFPGAEQPDYWDFVYFSFVIGMTSQVSDVAITCRPIRRLVTAHGIVSFAFNATLVALTVNIAASVI